MGRWVIAREGQDLIRALVYYDNLVTGERHHLGTVGADVPDTMLLEWIFDQGKPDPGDLICLSNGVMFRAFVTAMA